MKIIEKSQESEKFQQKHDNFTLHRKVKELSVDNKKTLTYRLLDVDKQPVKNDGWMEEFTLWKNYINNLFSDTREMSPTSDNE